MQVWSLDISQAHTRRRITPLEFFVRRDSTFGIDPNFIFENFWPLHGLADAGAA